MRNKSRRLQTTHRMMKVTGTSYRKDQRPRHVCEGCGELVRMSVTESGQWERHTCPDCGHWQDYRTG